jgi:hypothetical protein
MTKPAQQPRPALDSWGSIGEWLTATNRVQFEEDFNSEGCRAFADAHPDFPFCAPYALKMREFLYAWPLSRKNLEIAWASLDLGKITQVEADPERKTVRLNPMVAAQVAPRSEQEVEVLEKLKDVPYLHDSQRKARDAKLRAAAIASRNAHRKHRDIALIG